MFESLKAINVANIGKSANTSKAESGKLLASINNFLGKVGLNQAENDENERTVVQFDKDKLKMQRKPGDHYGQYEYVADGKTSFAEIKEEFGLEDGALRKTNSEYFKQNVNDKTKSKEEVEKFVPKKGEKLYIDPRDLMPQPVDFKDDNGKPIDGLYMTYDGLLYYEVQPDDNPTLIEEKLNAKSLSDYNINELMRGFNEYKLEEGTKVSVPKKGPISRFFTNLLNKIEEKFHGKTE